MKRKSFSAEEIAEFKRKRLEEKSKLTIAFQLVIMLVNIIVSKFLPTLSVDML